MHGNVNFLANFLIFTHTRPGEDYIRERLIHTKEGWAKVGEDILTSRSEGIREGGT